MAGAGPWPAAGETSPGSPPGLSLLQAVTSTLEKNPSILLARQDVLARRAALEEAKASFDWQLNASGSYADENTPLTRAQGDALYLSESGSAGAQVALEKLLPSGVVVSPLVEAEATDDKDGQDPTQVDSGVSFAVVVPLLKGSGKPSVMSGVRYADLDQQAVFLMTRHVVSESILNTVLAYWDYVAAQREVEIMKESEGQALKLVEDLERLVKAAERPASDIEQAQASYHDRTAARIGSERGLLEVKHFLGIQMGIPLEEIVSLPTPSDQFPELKKEAFPASSDAREYAELACRKRNDVLAYRKTEEAERTLLDRAMLDTRRQLDVIMEAGYVGAAEDGHMDSALDYRAGIELDLAFGNRAAQAQVLQREASCNQAKIQTAELERQVRSNVVLAMQTLRLSLDELETQHQAVLFHQKAVADETKKLRVGMSTMLALIDVDDRLRNAMMSEILSLRNAASALVRLRYEMGLLITCQDNLNEVKVNNLAEIPSLGE